MRKRRDKLKIDGEKLRLLREFGKNLNHNINFVLNTKAVIFIGARQNRLNEIIHRELNGYLSSEYIIFTMNKSRT